MDPERCADDRLASSRLKLQRADQHLDALRDAHDVYAASRSFATRFVNEADTDGRIWRIGRFSQVRKPDPEMGLIAADAIHNMRCALDHLMGALYYQHGWRGQSTPGFPLYTRAPRNSRERAAFTKLLAPISIEQRAYIKDCQPYGDQTVRGRRLGHLSILDNDDKHELIAPILTSHRRAEPGEPQARVYAIVSEDNPVPPSEVRFTDGPIEDGAEFIRFAFEADPHVQVHGTTQVIIGFGHPDLSLSELVATRTLVAETIDHLVGQSDGV